MKRLDGTTVLVTRAAQDLRGISNIFARLGASVIEAPAIRFTGPTDSGRLDAALANLHLHDWIVFTSPHGVDQALGRAHALGIPWPNGPRIAAVGEATSHRLQEHGMEASYVPPRFTTEDLAQTLPLDHKGRVLLLRARDGNPDLTRILANRGAKVEDVECYATQPDPQLAQALESLGGRRIDWLVFASPSTVEAFHAQMPAPLRGAIAESRLACIGPVTAEAARRHGYNVAAEARPHTIDGLVHAILEAHDA